MDIQRPIPNQKLRADWGRAVADALRAQGLDGPGVLRTPGGTSLPPVPPPGVRTRPPRRPWEVVAALDPEGGGWSLRVFAGLAVLDGKQLAAPADAAGSDVESGLSYFDVGRDAFGGESGFLVVAAGEEDGWELRREEEAAGEGGDEASGPWRAIAWIDWPADAAPKIRQLDIGVVDLGGGIHFGDAADAESRTEWEQTEEVPAILDLDGATRYKVLVDSRGNIISWTSGEEGEEPEDPSNPREPAPPCGNPLNDADDSNPLDRPEGAGGGGGGNAQEDHNPLDYEGDGGFTPTCGGEAA